MSRRKYRVLHLITRLELGGAQQNTLYCTANHDRALFDVELIAGAGGHLDDEARAIADARVQIVPWLRHEVDPWRDLGALFRLRSYMAANDIDVVHTHSSKAGILGRLAAHLAGVPLVVHTVHGWSFNDTQSVLRRRAYVALERLAATVTDRIVVVASKNREKGLCLGIGRPDVSKKHWIHFRRSLIFTLMILKLTINPGLCIGCSKSGTKVFHILRKH